ncbi:MAG: TrkA family potassium uptake protein [bacterium]
MDIIIVGDEIVIYFLTKAYIGKGHSVTVINRSREESEFMAKNTNAKIVLGDASDPEVLEDAGVHTADYLVSLTPNDHDNLIICQLAQFKFGVSETFARVNDPDNEAIFKELGIKNIFSFTNDLASLIEQQSYVDDVLSLGPVSGGKIVGFAIDIKESSDVVGQQIMELELPPNTLILSIERGEDVMIPNGTTRITAKDRITIFTAAENQKKAVNLFLPSDDEAQI